MTKLESVAYHYRARDAGLAPEQRYLDFSSNSSKRLRISSRVRRKAA